eukprot:TRINITY_DN2827_c3_g1_i1.p1 TRINITY_DN2827_c3_g1~~TRINITY_DN2827_c3_g1_i1.p1  ORF type:complete len:637 (-),score=196.71 TRINITY_DN2827_c3_g1_i1:27-1937(-)
MAQLHESFASLHTAIEDEDYEEVLAVSNKILSIQPDEPDAYKCKIVALVQLGRFVDVVQELGKEPGQHKYELAYALYRQKKHEEALAVLKDEEETGLELKAQIFYALERYQEAEEIYESLLERDGASHDLVTNLSATYVKTGNFSSLASLVSQHQNLCDKSFEFLYNAGTAFLERGDSVKAHQYLSQAKDVCNTQLSEEGVSQADIDQETAIIISQLAYLDQKKGNLENAKLQYEEVLSKKPTDITVKAACQNNIVTLREGTEKFDSLRKLNQLRTEEELMAKLSSAQQQVIHFNHCLMLLMMNKTDECRDFLTKLQEKYPTNDLFPLLYATILYKNRKFQKAQEKLDEFIQNHPESSVQAGLVMAQMHLNQGNVVPAIKVLTGIEKLKNMPAMICTLVSLYERVNDIDGAINVLDAAVMNINESESYYTTILRHNADFKFAAGRFEEAAKVYKKLLTYKRGDHEIMTNLIISLAQVSPSKARELEERLPELESDTKIDPEELENLPVVFTRITKRDKSAVTSETADARAKKPKTKKKRKNPPPKVIVPGSVVDPDRWKPKYERASYKGKRRPGRGGTRGAQGVVPAAAVSVKQETTAAPAAAAAAAKRPAPQTQTQQPTPPPTRGRGRGRGRGRK